MTQDRERRSSETPAAATEIKRLLVGSDGSEHARQAADLACVVARQTNARVTLLSAGGEDAAAEARRLGAGDVAVEARTTEGEAAAALVRVAERERFDLVVIGYGGKAALAEALLGSTTKRVLGSAPCPVLVARGPAPHAIERMLVALDDSDEARRAVEAAAMLARACGAALTLLHVVDTEVLARAPRAESMLRLRAGQDGYGKLSLLWANQLCGRAGLEAELVQVTGPAAQAILDHAVRRGADVVAVGRRERRGVGPLWLGGVSDEVLRDARGAVLVVGPRMTDASAADHRTGAVTGSDAPPAVLESVAQ